MSEHDTSTTPAPWERRQEESASAYRAFSIYRALPDDERTIDRAYQLYSGKAPSWKGQASGHFRAWSSDHDWVARAEAYDQHVLDEVAVRDFEEHVDQLRRYRERALIWAGRADAIALDLLERIEAGVTELEVSTPNDAARVARAARELMDSAAGARAQALSVEELLDALDREQG